MLELYAAQWTTAPADSVQEAFIRLAEVFQQAIEPPQNPVAWLYQVVRNQSRNAARAEQLGWGPSTRARGQAVKLMLGVQQWLDQFVDLGAHFVYALFRVPDLSFGGPTWVVPVSNPENTSAVMRMIVSGRPTTLEIERDLRPDFIPKHCETVEGVVLGAYTPEQLNQMRT